MSSNRAFVQTSLVGVVGADDVEKVKVRCTAHCFCSWFWASQRSLYLLYPQRGRGVAFLVLLGERRVCICNGSKFPVPVGVPVIQDILVGLTGNVTPKTVDHVVHMYEPLVPVGKPSKWMQLCAPVFNSSHVGIKLCGSMTRQILPHHDRGTAAIKAMMWIWFQGTGLRRHLTASSMRILNLPSPELHTLALTSKT